MPCADTNTPTRTPTHTRARARTHTLLHNVSCAEDVSARSLPFQSLVLSAASIGRLPLGVLAAPIFPHDSRFRKLLGVAENLSTREEQKKVGRSAPCAGRLRTAEARDWPACSLTTRRCRLAPVQRSSLGLGREKMLRDLFVVQLAFHSQIGKNSDVEPQTCKKFWFTKKKQLPYFWHYKARLKP